LFGQRIGICGVPSATDGRGSDIHGEYLPITARRTGVASERELDFVEKKQDGETEDTDVHKKED
jgi:hypothetical protein